MQTAPEGLLCGVCARSLLGHRDPVFCQGHKDPVGCEGQSPGLQGLKTLSCEGQKTLGCKRVSAHWVLEPCGAVLGMAQAEAVLPSGVHRCVAAAKTRLRAAPARPYSSTPA